MPPTNRVYNNLITNIFREKAIWQCYRKADIHKGIPQDTNKIIRKDTTIDILKDTTKDIHKGTTVDTLKDTMDTTRK